MGADHYIGATLLFWLFSSFSLLALGAAAVGAIIVSAVQWNTLCSQDILPIHLLLSGLSPIALVITCGTLMGLRHFRHPVRQPMVSESRLPWREVIYKKRGWAWKRPKAIIPGTYNHVWTPTHSTYYRSKAHDAHAWGWYTEPVMFVAPWNAKRVFWHVLFVLAVLLAIFFWPVWPSYGAYLLSSTSLNRCNEDVYKMSLAMLIITWVVPPLVASANWIILDDNWMDKLFEILND